MNDEACSLIAPPHAGARTGFDVLAPLGRGPGSDPATSSLFVNDEACSLIAPAPDRLAEVLAGSDVQVVLCGHLHHQVSGFSGGVPVWATPGVITRIDLTAPPTVVRGVRGAGATIIEFGGPYGAVGQLLTARDPRQGEEVYADTYGS